MTRRRRLRSLLLAAGGVVVVGSLLGARLLGPGGGGGTDASNKSAAPAAGRETPGTIVLGTADSDPQPARYGLPPVLQSGQVAEVFVKQGDEVKAGDKLYRFNSEILERKRTEADRAVDVARAERAKAQNAVDTHPKTFALQSEVVEAAKKKVELAHKARLVGKFQATERYKNVTSDATKLQELLDNDPDLYGLYVKFAEAEIERNLAQSKLDTVKEVEAKHLARVVAVAEAEVKRYEALAEEAKSAVGMCTVTAKVDGMVERVSVSPGDVMGISSTAPALILIPAGPRVVRAEVEAEFASKIGPRHIGQQVTIHDFTDPKVSFQGKVRGPLGGSFLPRRANEGALVQNETRVLEVVVEVLDAAPPGKPPLRVGQRVRVNFGP